MVQIILSDVIFMDEGRLVLQQSMASLEEDFVELHAVGENLARAEQIPYVGKLIILGGKSIIYEGVKRTSLKELCELRTPSVSDLFVAKLGGEHHHG